MPPSDKQVPQVRNDRSGGRFVIDVDGATAVLEYSIRGRQIVMPHTVVPESHRGRGYGSLLARAALDFAHEEALEVVALCPFVARFIERHPEYQRGS